MKISIFLSRCIGPALIALLMILADFAMSRIVNPTPVLCAVSVWCFAIGYIDRGWTEYLRSIGEIE